MSSLRPGAFGDERAAMAMSAPLETVRDPMMGAFFEPTALCILKSSRTNRLAPGDVDGERFDSVGLLGTIRPGRPPIPGPEPRWARSVCPDYDVADQPTSRSVLWSKSPATRLAPRASTDTVSIRPATGPAFSRT